MLESAGLSEGIREHGIGEEGEQCAKCTRSRIKQLDKHTDNNHGGDKMRHVGDGLYQLLVFGTGEGIKEQSKDNRQRKSCY
ncbi:hypothetical protein D3C80_1998720 [compost metagenome]